MPFDRKRGSHLPLAVILVTVASGFNSCLLARAGDIQDGLALTAPLDRQVFQREADGAGHAAIAGRLPEGAETIEARAVLAEAFRVAKGWIGRRSWTRSGRRPMPPEPFGGL